MSELQDRLVSVVYVSSTSPVFREATDVVDILRSSRANNAKLGITGLLLYKDGNFMQVLEGPEGNVTRLMEKVSLDARHTGVIVLLKKQIEKSNFEDWSMGFQNLSELSPEDLSGYSPFLNGSLLDREFQSHPESCYRLLMTFKSIVR